MVHSVPHDIDVVLASVLSFHDTEKREPSIYAELRLLGDRVISIHADGRSTLIATLTEDGVSWENGETQDEVRAFAEGRGEQRFCNGLRLKHRLCLPYYRRRERVLAAVADNSGEYIVLADALGDLDDMECPYVVMDSVRGLRYDIDELRPWTTRYPSADWTQVKILATDMTCETEYARFEMSRLLGCDTRDAERLLARVRGAYA